MVHPVINELQSHQADEQNVWWELSDERQELFYQELIEFAKTNQDELKRFCMETPVQEFGAHSIVLAGLSENSNQFNQLLWDVSEFIIQGAKRGDFKTSSMDILSDVDSLEMHDADHKMYGEFVDLYCKNLNNGGSKKFDNKLLDALDFFLAGTDEQVMQAFHKRPLWVKSVMHYYENGNSEQKDLAASILEELDPQFKPKSAGVFGKLKKFLGF